MSVKMYKQVSNKEQSLDLCFFLIYMDDIIDNALCDIGLFAADTSLLEIVHNAIESARRLNSDLKTLHTWFIQ